MNVGREDGEGLREVLEENAFSGANLHEVDRARDLFGVEREDAGQRGREGRRDVGRRQKVAGLADRRAPSVVAAFGVVQSRAHEVGEGDRTLTHDPIGETFRQRGHVARIIVSRVRSRSPRFGAFAAALLLLMSCSSRRDGALPTYEDYSDGTSVFAERLLAGWKAADVPPELFAASLDWSGPLPGEGLVPVASRPPLSIAIYRAGAPPPSVSGQGQALRR